MTVVARASVVVPVCGRAGLTRRCLEQLLADLPPGCEVVVVDDASTDATPQMLESFGDALRVLRLEQNRGYGAACNAGAEIAEGEHLVFLNNDTEPQAGWLEALLGYAHAHPEAEVIGARLLYPTGAVQHAGVVFGQDGYPHNLYAGLPGDHPAATRARRLQAVTGACMLVCRPAFERVQGFDSGFLNSMEDVDFCLRIGAEGGEVHYCPQATLVHLESATRGHDKRFEASVALYRERWREWVRRDDLEIYAEDGLIEVEYPTAHPLRISISPLLASVERSDRHEGELEPLLRAYARHSADLLREVVRLSAELSNRGVTVELPRLDYAEDVASIREQVERSVPEGATVLLVNRGDSELLRLGSRDARHFPTGPDGRYLGHHPTDDREAIRLLEAERRKGAGYLVIPSGESWWLRHYGGFAEHLEVHSTVELHEACAIYRLEPLMAGIEVGR